MQITYSNLEILLGYSHAFLEQREPRTQEKELKIHILVCIANDRLVATIRTFLVQTPFLLILFRGRKKIYCSQISFQLSRLRYRERQSNGFNTLCRHRLKSWLATKHFIISEPQWTLCSFNRRISKTWNCEMSRRSWVWWASDVCHRRMFWHTSIRWIPDDARRERVKKGRERKNFEHIVFRNDVTLWDQCFKTKKHRSFTFFLNFYGSRIVISL